MNILTNHRRFIVHMLGILSLILSLGGHQVAFAATSRSDIAITLVAHLSRGKGGEIITYTAKMTNLGPDEAFSTDTGFNLPDQLKLISLNCDQGISPDTPFCEYSSLKAGETVVSVLIAKPNPSAHKGNGWLTTTASVFFEVDCSFDSNCTLDSNSSNNSASITMKLTDKQKQP